MERLSNKELFELFTKISFQRDKLEEEMYKAVEEYRRTEENQYLESIILKAEGIKIIKENLHNVYCRINWTEFD